MPDAATSTSTSSARSSPSSSSVSVKGPPFSSVTAAVIFTASPLLARQVRRNSDSAPSRASARHGDAADAAARGGVGIVAAQALSGQADVVLGQGPRRRLRGNDVAQLRHLQPLLEGVAVG